MQRLDQRRNHLLGFCWVERGRLPVFCKASSHTIELRCFACRAALSCIGGVANGLSDRYRALRYLLGAYQHRESDYQLQVNCIKA